MPDEEEEWYHNARYTHHGWKTITLSNFGNAFLLFSLHADSMVIWKKIMYNIPDFASNKLLKS
jgi:hypothetical protein